MNRDRMNNRNRRQSPSDNGSGAAPEAPEQNRGRQRGNGGRSGSWFGRHRVFSIVSLSIMVVLLCVGGYFAYAISHPADVLVNDRTAVPTDEPTMDPTEEATTGIDPTDSATPGNTDNVTPAPTEEQPPDMSVFPKDIVNILMLGTDTGLNRVGMGARTDCIMLVSINTTTKKVSIISVPRDTYVKIYNEKNKISGRNRINATFAYGGGKDKKGIPYALNTASHFFGNLPIDHYVIFDMDLVVRLVNMMGGVTINVDVELSRSGPNPDTVNVKPGLQKLNGNEALAFARKRHGVTGGDFGRVGNQQKVLVAVLKELKNQGKISMIPDLYSALSKNVQTDLNAGQIAALAWIAKDVDIDGTMANSFTVPGTSLQINGASLVISDQQKKIDILKQVFGTKAGLDFKIKSDETYSYLYGLIKKQFLSGQTIINNANSLLNNNKEWYTAEQAAALRAAISAWTAASKKNDADGMADAQTDVQTQYDILKDIIDANKAAAATPEPTDNSSTDTPTDAPTEVPTTVSPPTDAPAT